MNQNYTWTMLKSISDALNSGRKDVTAVVITLSAVIIFFAFMSIFFMIKNKVNIKKTSLSAYSKLIRKFNLTILELDLVDKLAKTLHHPEKKYLLLTNKGTFRHAVHKTGSLGTEEKELIKSLSEKLGFSSAFKPVSLNSSKSFKSGMSVILETYQNKILPAEIHSVSDSGLVIKYFNHAETIISGEYLRLIICAFDGFKVFTLQTDRIKDNLFSAHHAEIEKIVKKKIKFEVSIEHERGDQTEILKTSVVLLAEKGAVLLNPPNRLKIGDDIRIYIANDKNHLRHVNAEVIKAPLTGKLVTVRYAHVSG